MSQSDADFNRIEKAWEDQQLYRHLNRPEQEPDLDEDEEDDYVEDDPPDADDPTDENYCLLASEQRKDDMNMETTKMTEMTLQSVYGWGLGLLASEQRKDDMNMETTKMTEMTLRDWFAGQVINGLAASGAKWDIKTLAADAYHLADGLLRERELSLKDLK